MLAIEDIREAARRIEPHAHVTPVMRSSALDRLAGASLFFKCEHLQRSGAFKFRGAANAVFSLPQSVAARGVVTHSSGNHAAALALAARLRGIDARIVIPEGATAAKVEAVKRYGAQVVRCAPTLADREATAARILKETGGELIHPYNDLRVMAGQGTVALEFLHQVPDLDAIVMPLSGGGLASGVATAARASDPDIRIIAVEPSGANDAARSLAAGCLLREPTPDTLCEGLRAFLGPLTFEVIRERVDAVVDVGDDQTLEAMLLIGEILKQVVEPSGAVGLAAVLAGKMPPPNPARLGIILTGGNVDFANLPRMPGGR